MNFFDRVFHPSKISALENQVEVLDNELKNRIIEVGEKDDLISMLDDEIRQVAISRYLNKYIEVTDLYADTRKFFKVEHITTENGLVALHTLKSAWVKNDESCGGVVYPPSINNQEDLFIGYETTLSHFKTISRIVRAVEYHKLVEKYS